MAIVVHGVWDTPRGRMKVTLMCDASDRKHCGNLLPGMTVFTVTGKKDKAATLSTTQGGKELCFTINAAERQ